MNIDLFFIFFSSFIASFYWTVALKLYFLIDFIKKSSALQTN